MLSFLLFESRETTLHIVIYLTLSKGRSSTFIVNLDQGILTPSKVLSFCRRFLDNHVHSQQ